MIADFVTPRGVAKSVFINDSLWVIPTVGCLGVQVKRASVFAAGDGCLVAAVLGKPVSKTPTKP